jgi:hypothetical protein
MILPGPGMRSIAGFRHLPLADCMFAFVRFWPVPTKSGDGLHVRYQGKTGPSGATEKSTQVPQKRHPSSQTAAELD